TRDLTPDELDARRADLAASYQRAIVRALTGRVREAAEQIGATRIAVVGGVAANSELRESLAGAALVPLALCTDNAAMIASAERVAAAGGVVGTERERAWTQSVITAQKLLVTRLAFSGVTIRPDYSFARVLDGFSAVIDPSAIPLIERDENVVAVYPVRVAY